MKETRAKPVSSRLLSANYIGALLIIFGLTIVSHLVIALVLHKNQGAAAIINMSGRQRMLSQRIAGLAAEYRLGDAGALADLQASIDEFATNETMLAADARQDNDGGIAAPALRLMYGPAFQAEMAAFIADARQVAAMPPGAPGAAAPLGRLFAQARAPLLNQLNAIVDVHQRENDRVLAELADLQFVIMLAVLLTLAAEALLIFQPMIRRIEIFTDEITRLAAIDPLTGLPNRRGFFDACAVELERARRHGRHLSVLMLDADHFKRINDTHGHAAGDEVLRHLADTLRMTLRASDIAGRMGGEEFAVLLPETDLEGARLLAQRVRKTIAEAEILIGRTKLALTVSLGVAAVAADEPSAIEHALQLADEAMYQAKAAGRNRVVQAA